MGIAVKRAQDENLVPVCIDKVSCEASPRLVRATCRGENFAGSKAVARLAAQREDDIVKVLLFDHESGVRVGGGVAALADVAYSLRRGHHRIGSLLVAALRLVHGRVIGIRSGA